MIKKTRKKHPNRLRSWLINLVTFSIVLLIFFIIDGTALEPKLNDSNNIAARAADWLLGSRMFNEWISPFSFSLFNLATTLFMIALFAKAITDLYFIKKNKQHRD